MRDLCDHLEPIGQILNLSSDGWTARVYPSPGGFLRREQRLGEPSLLFSDGTATHLFNVLGARAEDDAYSGFAFAMEGA